MNVTALEVDGLFLVTPDVFRDVRGFFVETWSKARYAAAGINASFVQDNHSHSVRETLRGLHYQAFGPVKNGPVAPGQAKLVRVVHGHIWDVVVDLRPDSPTFGRWSGHDLDSDDHAQLFIPAGCAHGFVVLSESADVLYKVSTPYDATTELGIAWDDPDLAIEWPADSPIRSARDRQNPSFADYLQVIEATRAAPR